MTDPRHRLAGTRSGTWGACSAALAVLLASGLAAGQGANAGDGSVSGSGAASGSGPGSGSGSASGSASGSGSGSGSASGAGSGSASGPRIIQLPTDINAPEVDASASPTAIRLGGRFTLFVTAVVDSGVVANLREPFELGPQFEIKAKDSHDTQRADGKTIREWQIDVTAWDLGDLEIPGIVITYTFQGKVNQVQTNAVRLRVDGVLGDVVDDPKALRPAHPPTTLITRDWTWLWIALAAIGALVSLGGYLTIRSLSFRKKTVKLTGGILAIPKKKIDMTAEKALAALQKIKESGVLDRDADRKKGYTEMVDVIRDYVGARYEVASRDLTSLELVAALAKVAPDDERALVEQWLEKCDLVKYAAQRATAAQGNSVLDDARALIVTTTQMRQAAQASAKAAA